MVDFLKNAFGSAFSANANAGTNASNEFVGQTIDVGQSKYRIKRLIAEGGFAYVYEGQDVSTGAAYAVKRLLSTDAAKTSEIVNEISVMKKLSGHPNIVRLVTAASIDKQTTARGSAEFIVVMELCALGQLVDVLARRPGGRKLAAEQVCQIIYQTSCAVQHCHTQQPPIVHRDLKLENLLLDARGLVKLCDFGSATTKQYEPDLSWSAAKRGAVEDEVTRNTTPMYRAPEMLDLYQNAPIGTPSDIWMIGCILFALCFERHPFEDSAKLKIINANYVIPPSDRDFTAFHELIRMMLQVDPRTRPQIDVVLAAVEQIAHEISTRTGRSVRLDGPIELLPASVMPQSSAANVPPPLSVPARPPPPSVNAAAPVRPAEAPRDTYGGQRTDPQTQQGPGASQMFSAFKSGAGALFSRMKDASSRVMDAVQANVAVGVAQGQPDLSYLTNRIVVMSFPSDSLMEQALRANSANDVRSLLERNHADAYAVYNLASRVYPKQRFNGRVIECPINPKRAPPLATLFALAKNVHSWLSRGGNNCAVIHCMDGKIASCLVVCTLVCLERLFDNVDGALVFFARKRAAIRLSASQRRYLGYICKLVHPERPLTPLRRVFKLHAVTMKPVPLFNRTRTGCRPFLQVFCGQQSVYSSIGGDGSNYEGTRVYSADHGRVQFEVDTFVYGDVTICCNHARVQNTAMANRFASAKLFDLQFHTGFLDAQQQFVHFQQSELDCTESADKYPENFVVVLELEPVFSNEERRRPQADPDADFFARPDADNLPPPHITRMLEVEAPWDSLPSDLDPRLLFQSDEEFQSAMNAFGSLNRSPSRLASLASGSNERFYAKSQTERPAAPSSDSPAHPKPLDSFFGTLNWQTSDDTTAAPTDRFDETQFADFEQFADFTQFDNAAAPEDDHTPSTDVDVDELIDVGEFQTSQSPQHPEQVVTSAPKTPANLDELFGNITVDSAAQPNLGAAKPDNLLNFDEDHTSSFDLLSDAFAQQPQLSNPSRPSAGLGASASFSTLNSQNVSHNPFPTADLLGGLDDSSRPSDSTRPTTASSTNILDDIFGSTGPSGPPPSAAPFQPPFTKPPNNINNLLNTGLNAANMRPIYSQPDLSRMNVPRPAAPSGPSQPQGPQSNPFWNASGSHAQPPLNKPHYDANLFSDAKKPSSATNSTSNFGNIYTGVKPQVSSSDFADLLGGQKIGANTFNPGKAKLNDMLVAKEVATMTPDEATVYSWAYGKETNLRGMLASLHTIVWQNSRWSPVALHELVQPDQVRRYYKRACLAVHPDKLGDDSPYQNLGRLILMELNKAHEIFERNELEADMQTPAQ